MTGQPLLVRAGTTELCMDVARGGGPQTVGPGHALAFDGVRECIQRHRLDAAGQ